MFEASGPFPEAGWDGVWVGSDPEYGMPLEVLAGLWTKPGAPTQDALKTAHKKRLDRRAVPLAVFAYDKSGKAWLFGPSTDAGVIELTQSQGQRLLQSALSEPDASSARTLLLRGRDALAEHGDAGVLLQGLFSDQQILRGLPKESGWAAACERGAKVLAGNHQDIDLVRALGFQHKEITGDAYLLSLGGEPPRAVAILLRSAEAFDAAGARFSKSPIYHGLEIARRNNVPWLVVARGSEIRLYPTSPSVGVGRRGATQTYFGLDLALIDESKAGYLDLAFSAKALAPNGSVDQILNDSKTYVAALSSRLRDRVYEDVVSRLSVAVAEKLREAGPLDADRLSLAYRLTLKILFRLLFQAYAEDIRVLPFQRNERYTAASLKQLARHMADEPQQADSPNSTSLFDGLLQVWRVIDHGDPDWGVPAYNGGLFGTDQELHPDGAAIEKLALTNDILGPALRGLLVDIAQDGTLGPVDFRSLDVRDFGTIYEGLLEAGLSIAEDNLADDGKGGWKVAEKGDTALVKKTHPYFHTKSGDRKATGSYFTPAFVVEHLLNRSLDLALDSHLSRVEELLAKQGDQVGAARMFFDFRVADLAMGSGHFLVAAISHIEQKFGSFLEKHPIPGVEKELIELRDAATKALAEVGVNAEIDRSGLLGRQIAKRCVYGIDINEIAVELARLAIWVRTFVPGLPMSSLDHQLVWGNSLTGIGMVSEAEALLSGGRSSQVSFADDVIQRHLNDARSLLEDAASLKESNYAEVRKAQEQLLAAKTAAAPAVKLLDAALALQLNLVKPPAMNSINDLLGDMEAIEIQNTLAQLQPVHYPATFPEVFLRDKPGFDVLIGNPPWEDVVFDEPRFWAVHRPGLMSLKVQTRDQIIDELRAKRPDLVREAEHTKAAIDTIRHTIELAFPLGKGHADLYKAFAWRMWRTIRADGLIGVVLPKTAFSAIGLEEWRRDVLRFGTITNLTTLVNSNGWVFDDVHPQYTVALATISKNSAVNSIEVAGVFADEQSYLTGIQHPVVINKDLVLNLTNAVSIPTLATQEDADIIETMRRSPKLSEVFGGVLRTVIEFNSTSDRKHFDHVKSESSIPVYSGRSYNLWQPSTGEPFAWANPTIASAELHERFKRQTRLKSSAFYGLDLNRDFGGELPYVRPRLVLRGISRPNDTRTCIAVITPPRTLLTDISPYILTPQKSQPLEAYLCGVMSSLVFDWYTRRFIETRMNVHFVNAFPIPDSLETAEAQRIVAVSAELLSQDTALIRWAQACDVESKELTDIERLDRVAEIDALVALQFGVNRKQLSHVFESFHRGWDSSKPDYVDRYERVMRHYDVWAAKA
jgi:hypothetical protein